MDITTSAETSNYPNPLVGIDLDEVSKSGLPRILVVEDDMDTLALLKQILVRSGFNVSGAMNGREALQKTGTYNPDLVLLDVMMPDMDGWETMRQLNKSSDVPVIMLTALATKENVVKGFQSGVDDYVTKPFYKDEIIARINAVLTRCKRKPQREILQFDDGNLIIDCHSKEVRSNGKILQLTAKEYAILYSLVNQNPSAVTYREIGLSVWGEDKPQIRQRIKYIVYLLRQKFKEINPSKPYIKNVGQLGYRFDAGG